MPPGEVFVVLFGEVTKTGVADANDVPQGILSGGRVVKQPVNTLSDELGDGDLALLGQRTEGVDLLLPEVDPHRLLETRGH